MSVRIKRVNERFSVSAQIREVDVERLAAAGVKSIICNRPDGEANDQPNVSEIELAAERCGVQLAYQPVISGKVGASEVDNFLYHMEHLPAPVHAYCRTGNRSMTLWSLYQRRLGIPAEEIVRTTGAVGFDMSETLSTAQQAMDKRMAFGVRHFDVIVVGGGAAGIAATSSLLGRDRSLRIAVIDPAEVHYYQPGWTLVGAGVFSQHDTVRTMASLIPVGAEWIKAAVGCFEPERNRVLLEDNRPIYYDRLVVAPGIKLDWHGVDGLPETLGYNGVTSNYRFDLAPYTWELVRGLHGGRALFTQAPMPIKCAGAPQKALYLSADHWRHAGTLDQIDIEFCNAGEVLFGVKEYVPVLNGYMEDYRATLSFSHRLSAIDGRDKKAWFEVSSEDGNHKVVEKSFDMIHVCPPQVAPDFVRESPLADSAGWIDVDPATLKHKRYDNIWALGDAMNAPNAKTAAAARMQAPVVANNIMQDLGCNGSIAHYNGYGSCPLTVERGKIVLAEFGYGGKLLPSFPSWLINGRQPSRLAWVLKERILPPVYWKAMLKGREWLVDPKQNQQHDAA